MKKKKLKLNRELRKSGLKGKKLLEALDLALLPKRVAVEEVKEVAPKKKGKK